MIKFLFFSLFILSSLFSSDLDEFDDFDNFNESSIVEVYDPLRTINEKIFNFNDFLFVNYLDPSILFYKKNINKSVRKNIDNFIYNLNSPFRITNKLLQGKPSDSFNELQGFIINSTIGGLGFFNPAKNYFNLNLYYTDFGHTLAFFNIPKGPYLIIPFLGPKYLRDISGNFITTEFTSPNLKKLNCFNNYNKLSLSNVTYTNATKNSFNKYLFVRDFYQHDRDTYISKELKHEKKYFSYFINFFSF
jgi:phospholipid-binding lipoprotein MlaA